MIDFAPLLETLVLLLAAALMAVGTWAIRRLSAKFGLEADSAANALLNDALTNAVRYAERLAAEAARARGASRVTDSETVAAAVNYVLEGVPAILHQYDITAEHVEKMVLARLGQ